MAGPLYITHLVKQMVGFTKRTCWQKKYQINKRKEFDLLCAMLVQFIGDLPYFNFPTWLGLLLLKPCPWSLPSLSPPLYLLHKKFHNASIPRDRANKGTRWPTKHTEVIPIDLDDKLQESCQIVHLLTCWTYYGPLFTITSYIFLL